MCLQMLSLQGPQRGMGHMWGLGVDREYGSCSELVYTGHGALHTAMG